MLAIDAKKQDVLKTFQKFGFLVVSEKSHIKLKNGKGQMISLPNHKRMKGATIAKELRRVGIDKTIFFQSI